MLGSGAEKEAHATQPMNSNLPKTRVPTASAHKPKQHLNRERKPTTATTTKRADNVDVTRAKGKKDITTGAA